MAPPHASGREHTDGKSGGGASTEDGRGSPATKGDHWTDMTGRDLMTEYETDSRPTLLPPGGTHSPIARRRGTPHDKVSVNRVVIVE
eukprot:5940491-Prymnesium_polylepis.1